MKGALLLTITLGKLCFDINIVTRTNDWDDEFFFLSFYDATVGLVAVQGHWELNKKYKYEVKVKALIPSSQSSDDKTVGFYYRLYLSLRPHSDDVIIGKITQAKFARTKHLQQRHSDENSFESFESNVGNFEDTPLSKPFKINLRNGVIKSLNVDRSMSRFEVNQLKLVMSQFQVHTHGQNLNSRDENPRYTNLVRQEDDRNIAFYKVTEPTANGRCETIYEISRIPNNLIRSHPEWVRLYQLRGRNGGVAEIVKTKNSASCNERRNTLVAAKNILKSTGVRENDLSIVETQRIVVSGEVERFTIQSARTTNKLILNHQNTPLVSVYVNATLESMESATDRSTPELPANLKIVEDFTFDFDYKMEDDQYQPAQQPRIRKYNKGRFYLLPKILSLCLFRRDSASSVFFLNFRAKKCWQRIPLV